MLLKQITIDKNTCINENHLMKSMHVYRNIYNRFLNNPKPLSHGRGTLLAPITQVLYFSTEYGRKPR